MILSEQEASTKICPLMSCREGKSRDAESEVIVRCQASGCMKWRCMENHSPEEIASRKEFKMPTPEQPKGYCGA